MTYKMTRKQYKEQLANTQTQQSFSRKLRKLKSKPKLPLLFERDNKLRKLRRFATTINEKQITFYAITKSEARAQYKALYGKIPVGQKFLPY
jgi:hypothetical protein